jgi:hypothetical protein
VASRGPHIGEALSRQLGLAYNMLLTPLRILESKTLFGCLGGPTL